MLVLQATLPFFPPPTLLAPFGASPRQSPATLPLLRPPLLRPHTPPRPARPLQSSTRRLCLPEPPVTTKHDYEGGWLEGRRMFGRGTLEMMQGKRG